MQSFAHREGVYVAASFFWDVQNAPVISAIVGQLVGLGTGHIMKSGMCLKVGLYTFSPYRLRFIFVSGRRKDPRPKIRPAIRANPSIQFSVVIRTEFASLKMLMRSIQWIDRLVCTCHAITH